MNQASTSALSKAERSESSAGDRLDTLAIRQQLGMSLTAFAHATKSAVKTVRRWDEGSAYPSAEALVLIGKLIEGKVIAPRRVERPELRIVEETSTKRIKRRDPLALLNEVERLTGLTPKQIAAALDVTPRRYGDWKQKIGVMNDYAMILLQLLVVSDEARTLASQSQSIKPLLPYLHAIPCDVTFRWSAAITRLRDGRRSKLGKHKFGELLMKVRPSGPRFAQEKVVRLEADQKWPTFDELESLAAVAKRDGLCFPTLPAI